VETEIDIDNFGGEFGDDPNHLQTYDSLFLKGQARLQLWNNRWEQKLSLALTDYDRSYENPTDSIHPFDSENASYKSGLIKLDWQHNFYLHPTNTLTFGVDLQQERGESKYISEGQWGPFESLFPLQKAGTTGVYIQDQIRFSGRLFVTLGIRLDSHSQFQIALSLPALCTRNFLGTHWELRPGARKVDGLGFRHRTAIFPGEIQTRRHLFQPYL
jgi:vitamin B12 transporter